MTSWVEMSPAGTSGPIERVGEGEGGAGFVETKLTGESDDEVADGAGATLLNPPQAVRRSGSPRAATQSFMAETNAIPDAPPQLLG
jgi:hypothetical protein